MTREKALVEILNQLELLYTDLNRLIAQYDREEWETTAQTTWKLDSWPYGITSFQDKIYIGIPCQQPNKVLIKNLKGETIHSIPNLNYAAGIEIDTQKSLIYISDIGRMTIYNFQYGLVSCWALPTNPGWDFRGIQLDGQSIFLTIYIVHQIFVCNHSGTLIRTMGTKEAGSAHGQFNYPLGISLDNKNLYVCDAYNDRVQVLTKYGKYVTTWGKVGKEFGEFSRPLSIYYYGPEEIFYIGDSVSLQLFDKNGKCKQRLGNQQSGSTMQQFNTIRGISILNNYLYVSDSDNCRIQIFRRK